MVLRGGPAGIEAGEEEEKQEQSIDFHYVSL